MAYLTLKHRIWYANHTIPPRYRHMFKNKSGKNKSRFVASTGEYNKRLAEIKMCELERYWLIELEKAKAVLDGNYGEMLECFSQGFYENESSSYIGLKGAHAPELVHVGDYIDEYFSVIGDKCTEKTKSMKRKTLIDFADNFISVSSVTKSSINKWIAELHYRGREEATIRRYFSEIRGYWSYLQSADVVREDNNPFSSLHIPKNKENSRSAFSAEQCVQIVNSAVENGDCELADVIRIAMFTGARIEEICTIKSEYIHEGDEALFIAGTKTSAAPRYVPIHPDLAPTLRRLKSVASGDDGYLFGSLSENKYGDKSPAIGKRFGRMKEKIGFGKDHVFHSIRGTFTKMLNSESVSDEMIRKIIGHKTSSVLYTNYIRDPEIAAKRNAINPLRYPGYVPA